MTDEPSPVPALGVGALLRPHGDSARGFLDTDHVTQNDREIARVLDDAEATVLTGAPGAVLGFKPSAENPRQVRVGAVGATPAQLDRMLQWAYSLHRATSWIAEVESGSEAVRFYTEAGFTRRALLRGHRYRSREYRDTVILYAEKSH